MRTSLWIWLALALVASSTARAQAPGMQPPPTAAAPTLEPPLRKVGLFHDGFSIELLDLGMIQAFTPHGHAAGIDAGIAFELDLGPRWALRLPIELGVGGFGQGAGYAEAAIVPGALYRFRTRDDQRWVPYLGGGLRFGAVDIGRTLVGLPLTPKLIACCHHWDWGDGGGSSDPDVESTSTTASAPSPELWAGYEWNRTRWFSLQLAGALAYERVLATDVFVLRETVGARVSF